MPKRLLGILLCALVLTGCSKFTSNEKKQANQTQTSTITQEETSSKENTTVSDSNNTGASQENETSNKATESEVDNSIKSETNNPSQTEASTSGQTEETVATLAEQSQDEIAKKYTLPEGFVYVDDVIPTVDLDIRYYTDYNFVGEKIDGYVAPLAILTTQAADALKVAADKLAEDGYRIRIYDAYRPQKAVQNFVRWAQTDDASMKDVFYPSMEKAVLFKDGYISDKSRHSRGSTIDMTIVDKDGNEIDMGGYFDLLDTRSNYDTNQITQAQHENREYLKKIMDEAGFNSIRTEWWHFQLREEPYPDTYFDFDIE
jgi:D-alanyl-D-alanine dipeptidase